MIIEYSLLTSAKGVALTRCKVPVEDILLLKFNNATTNTKVSMKKENKILFYKSLDAQGICKVPVSFLSGIVEISAYDLDKNGEGSVWKCEDLIGQTIDGKLYVGIADMDLQNRIAALESGFDRLLSEEAKTQKILSKIKTQLDEILNGYDIE